MPVSAGLISWRAWSFWLSLPPPCVTGCCSSANGTPSLATALELGATRHEKMGWSYFIFSDLIFLDSPIFPPPP